MTFKQISLIDDKYINLVIVFENTLSITEISPVLSFMYD